jgi:cyclic pyranopterin phosphate synthase
MKLVDDYGRSILRLRISLTEQCNMNCIYCHHEGYNNHDHRQLTMDQIHQIGSIIQKYEIQEIKLTGGEALLHPNIVEIVSFLSKIPTVNDLSLTTNGILLSKLAAPLRQAGLTRLNIGCDSLNKSSVKSVDNIYDGLLAAKKAGFSPIKLNMVLLKGINDHSINEMISFTHDNGIFLQIIELINTNPSFYKQYHVELQSIEEDLKNRAVKINNRKMQDRKQYYLDDQFYIELVRPNDNEHFCANCHTLRITHDFQFQPCLNHMDNLVPITNNIEDALKEAMKRRYPYYGAKKPK